MKKLLILLAVVIAFTACKKKKKATPDLAQAILVSPEKSAVCVNGTIVSTNTSSVKFNWSDVSGAESYILTIKSLSTEQTVSVTSTASERSVDLDQGKAYSWKITAKSGNASSISETWLFYNAGLTSLSSAPFPPLCTYPYLNQGFYLSSTGTVVSLAWNCTDPDNDLESYDVYFGSSPTPALVKNAHTVKNYTVTLSASGTYFWKVVAKDSKGNTATSSIYSFTVY